MGKRRGKKRKIVPFGNKRGSNIEPEELTKAPHSFVINRGRLGKNVNDLMMSFRKTMEPFTASQLKVKKKNCVKDFIHIAGPLKVSHLIIFTKSSKAVYFRVAKLPHGPTLTFQVKEYSLVKDVISSQKKPLMNRKLYESHPLLVLNNFSGEGMHFKLMASTFQNMFPSINVNTADLNKIKRTLLLNYNEDKTIDLRQYAVKVVPAGLSKAVKKLIHPKVPDLSKFNDVGDFMLKSGYLSDSEVEGETPANTVVLPQDIKARGNIKSEKSAIRLYEIGPRMKLLLVKIEEGIMSGEVLFHEFIKKTPEEVAASKAKLKAKKVLKKKRREEQERNVEKKKKIVASRKKPVQEEPEESDDDKDDDLEWYRSEVGLEPDDDVLPAMRKASKASNRPPLRKKPRLSAEAGRKHDPAARGQKKVQFSEVEGGMPKFKSAGSVKGKVLRHSAKLSKKLNRKPYVGARKK